MAFEARIYLQGVAVYVPDGSPDKLAALLPDQEKATEAGLRGVDGEPICKHYAVAQFDAHDLDPTCPSAWSSVDLSGYWVSVDSDSNEEASLFDDGGRLPGIPHLPEIFERAELGVEAKILSDATPSTAVPTDRLRAGFLADRGKLSAATEYKGKFRFYDGRRPLTDHDDDYTSVLKIELGEVERFSLSFRPFGGGEPSKIHFRPKYDQLEVWIRHFCDLERPDPDRNLPRAAGEPDVDFALNYALLDRLPELLERRGTKLPVPKVSSSWERGSPIGGKPNKCMGGTAGGG